MDNEKTANQSKDKIRQKDMDNNPLKYKGEFETVYSIIAAHRERVVRVVNNESMAMVWEVGGYVSNKLKSSAWGDGVVRQLAEYIHTQDPAARGWSYRTIYKMVQLYDTYSTPSFASLLAETKMVAYNEIMPFETAQMDDSVIVPFEMAQIPKCAVLYRMDESPDCVKQM